MYKGINILIGNACDKKCAYCLQTGENVPANKTPDVDLFIEKLTENLNSEVPKKIIIWGGEPMVYWTRVKNIICKLQKAGINPVEGFFISTNGVKMSHDYVDFVNANPVWTTISTHDWDFSEEQMDLFFTLKHFSLAAIIHSKNLNFFGWRERFYYLFNKYERMPRMCLHFLRANDGCGKEFYMKRSDVDILVQHLMRDVYPMALHGDVWALWQLSQLIFNKNQDVNKKFGPKCVRPDRLSIDLHGNIYECHHNFDASNIVGNLFQKTFVIRDERKQVRSPTIFADSDKCQRCEIFDECRGGCYLSNTHDVDCYLAKRMHEVYERAERLNFSKLYAMMER